MRPAVRAQRGNERAPPSAERRGSRRQADKPDPVVGGHPSRLPVAGQLVRPEPGSFGRATLERPPIWPCTGRGLPSRPVTRTAGGLLPHRFTLARTPRKGPLAVCSLLRFPAACTGWTLSSALLCGVRTFLDGRLAGSRRATRCGTAAATWLAQGVYHRVGKLGTRLRKKAGWILPAHPCRFAIPVARACPSTRPTAASPSCRTPVSPGAVCRSGSASEAASPGGADCRSGSRPASEAFDTPCCCLASGRPTRSTSRGHSSTPARCRLERGAAPTCTRPSWASAAAPSASGLCG